MREYLEFILDIVSDCFNITPKGIKGKGRNRKLVYARRFTFVLIRRRFPTSSLAQVGRLLNKGHATVMHSFKQHKADMEYIEEYRTMYQKCLTKVDSNEGKTHRELIITLENTYAKRIDLERKIIHIQEQLNDLD